MTPSCSSTGTAISSDLDAVLPQSVVPAICTRATPLPALCRNDTVQVLLQVVLQLPIVNGCQTQILHPISFVTVVQRQDHQCADSACGGEPFQGGLPAGHARRYHWHDQAVRPFSAHLCLHHSAAGEAPAVPEAWAHLLPNGTC